VLVLEIWIRRRKGHIAARERSPFILAAASRWATPAPGVRDTGVLDRSVSFFVA
jgi:hypothetical protein